MFPVPRRAKTECKCGNLKNPRHRVCSPCYVARKELRKSEIKNRNRDRQQRLLDNSQLLPAKNRKKAAIIDAILAKTDPAPSPSSKPTPAPKTMRYQSLEAALLEKLLKDSEAF